MPFHIFHVKDVPTVVKAKPLPLVSYHLSDDRLLSLIFNFDDTCNSRKTDASLMMMMMIIDDN